MRYERKMITAFILLVTFLFISAGCSSRKSDYIQLDSVKELKGYLDKRVSLAGQVSDVPWQHIISGEHIATRPHEYYFDMKDGQIVIYSQDMIAGAGVPIVVYGTVVETRGEAKGDPRESYVEYQLLVDRVEKAK